MAAMFHKTDDVPERIAQKDTDLVGEFFLRMQALGQLFQKTIRVPPLVADVL